MLRILQSAGFQNTAEVGKLEYNPAPLELIDFCRRLVAEMQLSASTGHSLNFVVESGLSVAADFKTASDDLLIHAEMDEKLLRQILGNLLSNAIKYFSEGGMIQLTLTWESPGRWLSSRSKTKG